MKKLQVAEVYKTVQGEGAFTGRPAVFVRLAGCNLWNGKDAGRGRPACAAWCDVVPLEQQVPGEAGRTSFASKDGPLGGTMTPDELASVIQDLWTQSDSMTSEHRDVRPFVVLTGGEPTLQVTPHVSDALLQFDVAVETNGTTETKLPHTWWVTVSPKGAYEVVRRRGNELKLVFPQREPEAQPGVWERLHAQHEVWFERYYLQPLEPLPGPDHALHWQQNTQRALEYVESHPLWRLSLQTHKLLEIP